MRRLIALNGNDWDEPATTGGTHAGVVLQTIGAMVETPELAAWPLDAATMAALPETWTQLKQRVVDGLSGTFASGLSSQISGIASPVAHDERLGIELKREVFAAQKGRRDAQWALRRAIGRARELVYVEAPVFGATAVAPASGELAASAWDLVAALAARLEAEPRLRVIIAVSRNPPYGRAYEAFRLHARHARISALGNLAHPDRVVAFHPIGFPGRPMQVRTTTVIVDDVWCSTGTSAPSRRGLTFDGGLDVVTFDRTLRGGVCASTRDHRRRLLAMHLGASAPKGGDTPSATWVRLGSPAGAFAAVKELADQQGRGLIEKVSPIAPVDLDVTSKDLTDPDGRNPQALLLLLASALADLER